VARGLVRAVVVKKPVVVWASTLLGLLTVWSTVAAQGPAGASNPAEEARRVLQVVEADESARELVSRAVQQSRSALDAAGKNTVAGQRAALEATALEWAELARDLKRTRDAEQGSDRLEQSLSALQTELVRTRASVEQAQARVGRARQELSELERSKGGGLGSVGAKP
jgi:hypothetical protein